MTPNHHHRDGEQMHNCFCLSSRETILSLVGALRSVDQSPEDRSTEPLSLGDSDLKEIEELFDRCAHVSDALSHAVSVASTDWEKEFGLTPTPLPDDDSSTTYLTASPSSVVASPSAIDNSQDANAGPDDVSASTQDVDAVPGALTSSTQVVNVAPSSSTVTNVMVSGSSTAATFHPFVPAEARWYAVFVGRNPGVYNGAHHVTPNIAGISGGLANRYGSFQEATTAYQAALAAQSVVQVTMTLTRTIL
ncbi:hypothetical protein K443DRAFT_126485 [Laccaria amethystina LaAM-08-1]|uniref:Unplaced genomic scaffold K443scaffold_633, whole genome shotgun sequence n=1 Tax=Laccaria amethystina LaAM-08-1 TaxID=1095629 RepID=A0A0C9WLR1_9AGAR|nr:hypothetical protein K443DRAFT_126485 [Laccaria amethystina LaAM-08-1]